MQIIERILRQHASLNAIASHFETAAGRAQLQSAAGLIRAASNVCMAGMGGSRYALMPSATYLQLHRRPVAVMDAAEQLYYCDLPPGSLAVLMSRSGRTVETVKLAEKLRAQGVPVVALTNAPDSSLGRAAAATVFVPGDSDEGVSIQSFTGGLLTALYLASETAGQFKAIHKAACEAAERMPEMLAASRVEAEAWPLESCSMIYLLGRGYSLASAAEGCLLFHELAHKPACWYGAAEFGQGPVEVLTASHAVLVLAPAADRTAHLNETLAAHLKRTGAQVITVRSDLPEFLAPIEEIVKLQYAACALAARASNVAGAFRFAAATTTCEGVIGL